MPTISACIISFNEEDRIRDCLESVKWCDEIIVVDSHSTDRTREIAREYTRHVIERDWPGHVEQKNFAADRATSDWILGIDCDERVTPELESSIEGLLSEPQAAIAGYLVARLSFHLGRFWRRGGWYPDRAIRVWRRGRGRWGGDNPHDRVEVQGPVGVLAGELLHYTYDDLADHVKQINFFTSISSRSKAEKGVRPTLLKLVFHPLGKFLRMYLWKRAFLDGVPGFILSVTGAYYVFLKYAKMWEATYVKKAGR